MSDLTISTYTTPKFIKNGCSLYYEINLKQSNDKICNIIYDQIIDQEFIETLKTS